MKSERFKKLNISHSFQIIFIKLYFYVARVRLIRARRTYLVRILDKDMYVYGIYSALRHVRAGGDH